MASLGSMKADSYWVSDIRSLSKEPDEGVKLKLGHGMTQGVVSESITFTATLMTLDVDVAEDLRTIYGGSEGNVIMLRSTSATRVITVKQGTSGNIRCGADIELSPEAWLMFIYTTTPTGSAWFIRR